MSECGKKYEDYNRHNGDDYKWTCALDAGHIGYCQAWRPAPSPYARIAELEVENARLKESAAVVHERNVDTFETLKSERDEALAQVAAMREVVSLAAGHPCDAHPDPCGECFACLAQRTLAPTAGADYEHRIRAEENERARVRYSGIMEHALSAHAANIRAEERERCAKVAEECDDGTAESIRATAAAAAAIRALSKPEDTQC